MSCSWCEERLARFIDDELSPRDRAGVLAHVERCRPCNALFEELRNVDGLLLSAQRVELDASFTRATMESVRTMAPPCRIRAPLRAYAVCYLLAAWLLTGAAVVLSPNRLREALGIGAAMLHTTVDAFAGVGHVALRAGTRGEIGAWTLVIGGIVALDALLAVALLRLVRLRGGRLRW